MLGERLPRQRNSLLVAQNQGQDQDTYKHGAYLVPHTYCACSAVGTQLSRDLRAKVPQLSVVVSGPRAIRPARVVTGLVSQQGRCAEAQRALVCLPLPVLPQVLSPKYGTKTKLITLQLSINSATLRPVVVNTIVLDIKTHPSAYFTSGEQGRVCARTSQGAGECSAPGCKDGRPAAQQAREAVPAPVPVPAAV